MTKLWRRSSASSGMFYAIMLVSTAVIVLLVLGTLINIMQRDTDVVRVILGNGVVAIAFITVFLWAINRVHKKRESRR